MKKLFLALALCCALLPAFSQEKISDKDLVNVIYAMGQMYPDGFTLDLSFAANSFTCFWILSTCAFR